MAKLSLYKTSKNYKALYKLLKDGHEIIYFNNQFIDILKYDKDFVLGLCFRINYDNFYDDLHVFIGMCRKHEIKYIIPNDIKD